MSHPVGVSRAYVDSPFGQMHIRQAGVLGDRPPLLCFHMSPMSGRIYEAFLEQIGEDRLTIAPDTPGYGTSDPPNSPPDITDYASAMADLINAMRLPTPVDLFGYHTGSKIAFELSIKRPELVRRIVTVSAPLYTDEERKHLDNHYHPEPPDAGGAHLLGLWRSMVHWHLHSGASLEDIEDQFPDILLGRGRAGWGHRAAFRYDLKDHLHKVEKPVLVLRPKDDLYTQTGRAADHLQNGRIIDLIGWGHGFLTRNADAAARLVRQFLDAPDNAPFRDIVTPSDALVLRPLPDYLA